MPSSFIARSLVATALLILPAQFAAGQDQQPGKLSAAEAERLDKEATQLNALVVKLINQRKLLEAEPLAQGTGDSPPRFWQRSPGRGAKRIQSRLPVESGGPPGGSGAALFEQFENKRSWQGIRLGFYLPAHAGQDVQGHGPGP